MRFRSRRRSARKLLRPFNIRVIRLVRPSVEQLEERILMSVIPDAYVGGLYHDLLGREVDAGGLAYWTERMAQGATPIQVAHGVADSVEGLHAVVQQDYTAILRRDGDPSGLATFTHLLEAGATPGQVAAALLGSPEYASIRADG